MTRSQQGGRAAGAPDAAVANPKSAEVEAYHALCAYTLNRGDAAFVHQHVVDAFAAQQAGATSKPIQVTFALVGLLLAVEKGYTGRQVQLAHMQLARRGRTWPSFTLPARRGAITAADVLAKPAGPERDAAIHAWCAAVWEAYAASRQAVASLLERHGVG